jgi:deazaflavin-dependent oxidoreductase (nitroreductase family)
MPNVKDYVAKFLTAIHEGLYRISGGAIGGRLFRMPVLLLTTTGRNSGQPRTTPLTYFEFDGDVVLVASYGGDDRHPQWYKNLSRNPEVTIERGRGKERVTARTASADEKQKWWPTITSTYSGYADYQKRTTREIPLVVLAAGTRHSA